MGIVSQFVELVRGISLGEKEREAVEEEGARVGVEVMDAFRRGFYSAVGDALNEMQERIAGMGTVVRSIPNEAEEGEPDPPIAIHTGPVLDAAVIGRTTSCYLDFQSATWEILVPEKAHATLQRLLDLNSETVCWWHRHGASYGGIANALGCSRTTISQWFANGGNHVKASDNRKVSDENE